MDTPKTEKIYSGNLCLKCHKSAISRMFWGSSGVAALFLIEMLFLLGAGKQRLREFEPKMTEAMRETMHYIIHGGVLLARGLQHRPFDAVRLFAIFGSFIAIPCLLIWTGWQWKLARHGIPSKLQRPYSVWETMTREFSTPRHY